MRKRSLLALALILLFAPGPGAAVSADKKEYLEVKLALDQLKAEVIVLERQIRSMQESMDRSAGQMSTLITQVSDNVAAIRQAQSRVAEGSVSALREVGGVGERLIDTNQRIDRLSEQMAELKRLVEELPKMPTFTQITPGNPDQLFAAAYGDYSRGNYDLAISEFRQYVETYPSSEMADNAQYWIGESLFAKRRYEEAIAEFDKVLVDFAKGDKVPAARLKKAMALLELGQGEAARTELQALIRAFPRSTEAVIARQQLGNQ